MNMKNSILKSIGKIFGWCLDFMIGISLIICIIISAIALLPISIIFGLLALCYYTGVWCKIINKNDYKDNVNMEESITTSTLPPNDSTTTTTTTSSTPRPSTTTTTTTTTTTRKPLNFESTWGPDSTSGYDVY